MIMKPQQILFVLSFLTIGIVLLFLDVVSKTSKSSSGTVITGQRSTQVQPTLSSSLFEFLSSPSSHKTNDETTKSKVLLRRYHDHQSRNLQTAKKSSSQKTIFYAMGDIPYKSSEYGVLAQRINDIPSDGKFLVHVGDIRSGETSAPCSKQEDTNVANVLSTSRIPVFILPGDNEWNDCTNYDVSPSIWHGVFDKFESKYWSNAAAKFKVTHPNDRTENFTFQYNGTLFIGLNLVGGAIRSKKEWNQRLTDEYLWTVSLIRSYQKSLNPGSSSGSTIPTTVVGRVIIFGHANPTSDHRKFFGPFGEFIQNELQNAVPILYLHGDWHEWIYEPNYLGQPSFLRISMVAHGYDPALKITVSATGKYVDPQLAFVYDRRL